MAKTIHTDKAPAAIGPYVQGKIVGNLLFASGQVPLSPETGESLVKQFKNKQNKFLKMLVLFWQKQVQTLITLLKQLAS